MKEVRKMYNSKSVKSEEFIDHENTVKRTRTIPKWLMKF